MGSSTPISWKHRFTPYDLPLALFLVGVVMGLFWTYDISLSWLTMVALCLGCVLYVLSSRISVEERTWEGAAFGLAGLSFLVAFYYILQFGYLDQTGKVAIFSQVGRSLAKFVSDFSFWKPLANSVATFLEGGLFLTLGLALTARRISGRVVGFTAAAVMAFAILLSASRGAWLGVLAAGLLWVSLYWRTVRYISLVLLGLLVVMGMEGVVQGNLLFLNQIPLFGGVLGELFIRPDRLAVYTNSLDLLRAYPWTGIGLGDTFGMVYSRYALLLFVPFLFYSHNLFLEAWLQQGILGLAGLIWLTTSIYTSAWIYRQANPDIKYQSTWIGLSAILIHGMSDARQFESLWCWLPFFGLLGLNAAVLLRRGPRMTVRTAWLLPPVITGTIILCIILWLGSVPANIKVNQGALLQTRADLQAGLTDELRQQKREQAQDLFQEALQIDSSNWPAQYRLGLIQLQKNNFPQALEDLEAARQRAPGNFAVGKSLGLAYAWNGQIDKAVALVQNIPGILPELSYWEWYFTDKKQPQIENYTHQLIQKLQAQQ